MATRYWVGGNGTWDASTTTNWATVPGGAGGASAPTSSDNVVFDGSSGGVGNTVNAVSGAVCANMTYASGATIVLSGFAGVYGAFVMEPFSSTALAAFQVLLYGNSARGANTSYVQSVTCLNAGTTTLTGTLAARYFVATGATVDLNGYALYTNRLEQSSGTLSNGSVYFSGYNASNSTLYLRSVWSTASLYVETGAYTPNIDISFSGSVTAADLGSIVFNAAGTSTIDNLKAKNITVNAGTLNKSSLLISCYGNFYLDPTAAITASSVGILYMYKVSGSPTATRTLRIDGDTPPSGSYKFDIQIDAGTDTVNVTGDGNGLGSNTYPVGSLQVKSPANFSCTTIYAANFYVASSVACDISALTSVNVSFFGNSSIGLVPGSCAVNIKNYYGYGFGQFGAGGVTIASVTVVDAIPLRISGNNTIGTLTCASSLGQGSTKGLQFAPGSTQTVTGSFILSGASASDTVSLGINGSGSAATISKASGTVTATYATISYSNATGGAVFKAPLTTNVNGGNNTGWIFTAAGGGNFFNFF